MAVHGRDEVDKAQGCEGPALPAIVNTSLVTTTAVARLGPPPATAAHAPRHCGGVAVRNGGTKRVIMGPSDSKHVYTAVA